MKKINFLIGTKGQLIKTAPVLKLLDKENIDYNFINAAQHGTIFDEIIDSFELKKPDLILLKREKDVLNTYEEIKWFAQTSIKSVMNNKDIFENSIIVVHGDAPPVFLGKIINTFVNSEIAHIEAGLRSFDFFDPFPEEIFRYIIDRRANYLYAPGNKQIDNLTKMGSKGEIINTKENTVLDSIRYSIFEAKTYIPKSVENSVLFTVHRYETLKSKERLELVLKILNKIKKSHEITFVMHNTTKNYLEKYQMLDLISDDINVIPLQKYTTFINMIHKCKFVVTDGGGLQEETTYLGKPCLILRNITEREHGLGANAVLSKFDPKKIDNFLKNYEKYKNNGKLNSKVLPSKIIVNHLKKLN